MLSGLFGSTRGDAYVGGHPLSEMDSVRRSLGLCPQFSVVWNDLTPSERLLFYARLKGVPLKLQKPHAVDLLRKVGLDPAEGETCGQKCLRRVCPKEKRTSQLSGGMQRRLAIAIGLTGSPDVLLLDEPTTGLDPSVRREIWDVILQEKKRRCVILTTHSMEEADCLSDRIGIMSHGRMICVGTSLHLKERFGNGYTLQLKHAGVKSGGTPDRLRCFIQDRLRPLANVTLLKSFGNTMQYEMRPREGVPFRVSSLFEELVVNKGSAGILDYEMSQSTLEDVFLNVIALDEEKIVGSASATLASESPSPESPSLELKEVNMDSLSGDDSEHGEERIVMNAGEALEEEEGEVHESERDAGDDSDSSSEEEEEEEEELFGEGGRDDEVGAVVVESAPIRHVDERLPVGRMSCGEKIGSFCTESCTQVWYFFAKEFILSLREWCGSCFVIISPFFVILALSLLALIFELNVPEFFIHPDVESVTPVLPSCKSWAGVKCYRLAYTTNGGGNPLAGTVMGKIIADNSWVLDEDYLVFPYERMMVDFISGHPNTTDIAVSFSNETLEGSALNATKYSIYFNRTALILPFKNLIDDYLIDEVRAKTADPSPLKKPVEMKSQSFPKAPNRRARNGQKQLFGVTGPLFFLDEPTTGLDPFSKREVWKLVLEKKKESAIILTTHSMEEADALADKIIIFHKGRVKCLGDSLHLKSKYGAGYVLKFVCDTNRESSFPAFIEKNFPHAVQVSANAGNYIFSLKPAYIDELVAGLKAVEALREAGHDKLIRDFGLCHDSLETIYMKVTADADAEGEEETVSRKCCGC